VGETGLYSCGELEPCSLCCPCCAIMVARCVVLPRGYLLAVAPPGSTFKCGEHSSVCCIHLCSVLKLWLSPVLADPSARRS
jgi:hypothetical protein